jgi:hypothetical protein
VRFALCSMPKGTIGIRFNVPISFSVFCIVRFSVPLCFGSVLFSISDFEAWRCPNQVSPLAIWGLRE